ncbi:MAG: class I SAM-dependent methyltransferase [Gemmataceae bacterium]
MSDPWDAGLYDGKHDFVWRLGDSLVELLAPRPGERILDLGCGTGHLTAKIAEAGAEVVGLDPSAAMLATARQAYPRLTFVEGDARGFALGAFDAVFSNAALHWVRPPEAAVRAVAAALKPGGRFVAEFGGKGNVAAIAAAYGAGLPDWYFPGVAEYAALLEGHGLEVRFATLFDRPTPLDGEAGLRDWVRQFAPAVPEAEYGRVEAAARHALWRDGRWVADYRRLRVVAVKANGNT